MVKKIDLNVFNHLSLLVKRISILFILYQLLRIIFYLANKDHFEGVSLDQFFVMMQGGLRFDLASILYLNAPFILMALVPSTLRYKTTYKATMRIIFLVTNSIGMALNVLDIYYYDYILKRTTANVFMFLGEENLGQLFVQFFKDYYVGFLIWLLLTWILHKWYTFFKLKTRQPFSYAKVGVELIVLAIVCFLGISGIRGGFGKAIRPITISNAGAYTQKPQQMAIVLNTPFSIIRTLFKKTYPAVRYYPEDTIEKIYTPVHVFSADTGFIKKNVVILIVESLAKEYIGGLNKELLNHQYSGYTPFLDSLIDKSEVYTQAFANGRKSIDALPAIISGIPSWIQPFVLSPYSTNRINGLGLILKDKGYETAFFHGAKKGAMGFNAFMHIAGFEHFYGLEQYGDTKDYDGNWGIWDEEFLSYTAQQINELKEPFISTIFTLSSHHPFHIPDKYQHQFKEGTLPIHKTVRYTDFSIKKFLASASQMPWYTNTLFIITADHCNQSDQYGYNALPGAHAIPIIIFDPSHLTPVRHTRITQQMDIPGLILNKLNYTGSLVTYGNHPDDPHPFWIAYAYRHWYLLRDGYMLVYAESSSPELYDYQSDKILKYNVYTNNKQRADNMIGFLKAVIQQYYTRMREDHLTTTKQ